MSNDPGFNPQMPESWQFTPPAEGGNGAIHQPGQFHNLIWQTRNRQPEAFEISLIATLEELFADGVDTLPQLVSALNQQRVFDRSGQAWSEASFAEFLQVNGY